MKKTRGSGPRKTAIVALRMDPEMKRGLVEVAKQKKQTLTQLIMEAVFKHTKVTLKGQDVFFQAPKGSGRRFVKIF